ncbi:MAG: peptidylprolyl isomerase [Verrucomicrobia bacterium]|nr:peptidylprolyl isomerase [Verrucomicrobiota bacterium]
MAEVASPGALAQPAPPADPAATVVTVNGKQITEGEVSEQVEKRVAVQKQRMPEGMESPWEQKQMLRASVVDMLVEMKLIAQKLDEKNIAVTEEQVVQAIQTIAGQRNQTVEELEKETAEYGMTMADLKEQVGLKLRVDALMEAEMDPAKITEADAKLFFDQNPQHFTQPEQVKASHILCGKRGITESDYPAELEKIKAAQARLNGGEAFAEVAKAVSTCPSSAEGGDLGFFGKGQMDPAFEAAAFELEVGQTSDIVKSSFGYHLIKVTDKKPAGSMPFEEVKEDITRHLTQQKQREFWTEYNQALKDQATIAYSAAEQSAREAVEQSRAMQRQMMQQLQPQQP